jgi:regulator of protease activity HflC (stomatin/prohibitin superfamily)
MKKLLLAFIAIILLTTASCTRIDAGHVGLKINMAGSDKGVSNVTEVTGWVFYLPWATNVEEFPVFTQTVDYDAFVITTKDAAQFIVDPTLNYTPNSSLVPQIYTQYRKPLKQIESTIMRNIVYDAYRLTANKFTSDSIMGNRGKFEEEAEKYLNEALSKDGFKYERITSNLTPPESLQEMINAKNKAVQEALKATNEVKTAEANAKIAVAKAQGTADAKKIEADGIYYYNQKVQQSLTPLLIEKMRIEKWDGEYPNYMLGNSSTLLNIK